jgi:hypothetical protein
MAITIHELLSKLQKFDAEKEAEIVIKKNASFAILLNQQQLTDGLNLTGNKITQEYASFSYAGFKNRLNTLPGFGTPDLKIVKKGGLHDDIIFDKVGGTWQMFNKSILATYPSITQYGDIWGLTRKSTKRFRNKNDEDYGKVIVAKIFK